MCVFIEFLLIYFWNHDRLGKNDILKHNLQHACLICTMLTKQTEVGLVIPLIKYVYREVSPELAFFLLQY